MKPIICALIAGGVALAAAAPAVADVDSAVQAFNAGKYKEALQEFELLADQDKQPTALSYLGTMYERGVGVSKDYVKAIEFYTQAAELGHTAATYSIAHMYLSGRGVDQSPEEAARWFRLAGLAGHTMAQVYVADLYFSGRGLPQDGEAGLRWLTRAAEAGNLTAQFMLGRRLANGDGVGEDKVRGLGWLLAASGRGEKRAEKAAGELRTTMAPEEIQKSQGRAKKINAGH